VRRTGSEILVLFLVTSSAVVWPQTAGPANQGGPAPEQPTRQSGSTGDSTSLVDAGSESNPQTVLATPAVPAGQGTDNFGGKQTKRMFWVVPNFAAVNADTKLPPLSVRDKFALARQDSVDYSSLPRHYSKRSELTTGKGHRNAGG
jgi:hypothetical protein